MRRIEKVEDRVDRALQQIVRGEQQRDRILEEVAALVGGMTAVQESLDAVDEVRYRQLPQYVDTAAALATTIESSAALAERSSRRVKRLDALHTRVAQAKLLAEAMMAMRRTVEKIPAALGAGDLDTTVVLLSEYETARQQLLASSSSSSSSSTAAAAAAPRVPAIDSAVQEAREEACGKLTARAKEAMAVNDKLTVMKCSQLLAQLGLRQEGMELYCRWMCDHTITALKRVVEVELRRMASPTEAARSHLALVSQALDTVAAAYEAEEPFTRETFGHAGPLLLLSLLHQQSTAECVPVLHDFIEKRKGALTSLQQAEERARGAASTSRSQPNDSDDGDSDGGEDDAAAVGEGIGQARGLLGETNADGTFVDATRGAADARRADQTLEETSHLVSCCHIYLDFAETQREEHLARLREEEAGEEERKSTEVAATAAPAADRAAVDRLWGTGAEAGSSLLSAVQDILVMYVPLQVSYFKAAFRQALQLQLQAIREGGGYEALLRRRMGGQNGGGGAGGGASPKGAGAGPLPPGAGSPASLVAGLTNMYAAALGGGAEAHAAQMAMAAALEAETAYYSSGGALTLPDDVFFFLRIAVHRALNTKSTQIASAVIMSAADVIERSLVPEIARRAAGSTRWRRGAASLFSDPTATAAAAASPASAVPGEGAGAASAHPPTPRALRWACAGQKVVEYCRRLAQELRTVTGGASSTSSSSSPSAAFSGRDAMRFRELAQDMELIATDLHATVQLWMRRFARQCAAHMAATSDHLARLAALSYSLSEDTFYHYELNDPWVQSMLIDWGALLDYAAEHLRPDPALYDRFLVDVAGAVAQAVRAALAKKTFSTFGALQADRDVRALREFFYQRADAVSTAMREVFAPLGLMATLLLCDSPRDALEEAHNNALTAEEKRSVLLLRSDFKKQDVMALKL